jgi:hypothetical protein
MLISKQSKSKKIHLKKIDKQYYKWAKSTLFLKGKKTTFSGDFLCSSFEFKLHIWILKEYLKLGQCNFSAGHISDFWLTKHYILFVGLKSYLNLFIKEKTI